MYMHVIASDCPLALLCFIISIFFFKFIQNILSPRILIERGLFRFHGLFLHQLAFLLWNARFGSVHDYMIFIFWFHACILVHMMRLHFVSYSARLIEKKPADRQSPWENCFYFSKSLEAFSNLHKKTSSRNMNCKCGNFLAPAVQMNILEEVLVSWNISLITLNALSAVYTSWT